MDIVDNVTFCHRSFLGCERSRIVFSTNIAQKVTPRMPKLHCAPFLLGHSCDGVGFGNFGFEFSQSTMPLLLVLTSVAMIGFRYWRYLQKMRGPVLLYMGILGVTLVPAWGGAAPRTASWGILLFAVFDFFVLRQRFVVAASVNRFIGLPLYYAGQTLLAWSLGR